MIKRRYNLTYASTGEPLVSRAADRFISILEQDFEADGQIENLVASNDPEAYTFMMDDRLITFFPGHDEHHLKIEGNTGGDIMNARALLMGIIDPDSEFEARAV
jgi:hypothetical protein